MSASAPIVFADRVNRIRQVFLGNPSVRLPFTELCRSTATSAPFCAAAVAALVNEGFLVWRSDTLTRRDAPSPVIKRRTA